MNARALEQAVDELKRKRRQALEGAGLAVATGALAAAASFASPPLAVALAVGAAVQAVLAASAFVGRRELIARLALEPDAYVIPEVERYGCRLTRPAERERLARGIRLVLGQAHSPGSLYLADRVAAFAQELESLARDLLSPARRVQPTSAVACLRLLTRAVESPLYNPRLPAEDLRSILHRIRAGIG